MPAIADLLERFSNRIKVLSICFNHRFQLCQALVGQIVFLYHIAMLLSACLGIADMIFQKLNGLHEALRGDRHDQINGVEVALAIKTSAQVGLRICRRMKAMTNRTAEPEDFFALSPLKSQSVDKQINVDVIAQPS